MGPTHVCWSVCLGRPNAGQDFNTRGKSCRYRHYRFRWQTVLPAMGQGRQLVWCLLAHHNSGSQTLFELWSVFGRMRGSAHPAMAPASTPKATPGRALLGISHDQASDSYRICPAISAAKI